MSPTKYAHLPDVDLRDVVLKRIAALRDFKNRHSGSMMAPFTYPNVDDPSPTWPEDWKALGEVTKGSFLSANEEFDNVYRSDIEEVRNELLRRLPDERTVKSTPGRYRPSPLVGRIALSDLEPASMTWGIIEYLEHLAKRLADRIGRDGLDGKIE